MAIRTWSEHPRGFLKKRPAGIVSTWAIDPGADTSRLESAVIMAIFNSLIARKMRFEEVPRGQGMFGIKAKRPLIQYAIDGGVTYLLVHGVMEKGLLKGFSAIVLPADPSVQASVEAVKEAVDAIPDPFGN